MPDNSGSSNVAIVAIVILVILAGLAIFYFMGRGGAPAVDGPDIEIEAPDIELPATE